MRGKTRKCLGLVGTEGETRSGQPVGCRRYGCNLIVLGLVLFGRRGLSFGHDSGSGFGVVGGGLVEQGYASLMTGCGACSADCWMSRLVVLGPPWRVSLDNPSCRTFLQRTRVQWELFDYSNGSRTVSNANLGCVTGTFQSNEMPPKSAGRARHAGLALFDDLRNPLARFPASPMIC